MSEVPRIGKRPQQGKRVRFPHDRVTVRGFAICDCGFEIGVGAIENQKSKIKNVISRVPVADTIASNDVSRQNIAG